MHVISCVEGDCAGALRWLQKIVEDGMTPNKITYNSMIDAHAKAGVAGQSQKDKHIVFHAAKERERTAGPLLPWLYGGVFQQFQLDVLWDCVSTNSTLCDRLLLIRCALLSSLD